MNTLKLLNSGSIRLKKKNVISHQLDAEILLSKVLSKNRENILINLNKKIKKRHISEYNRLITRRSKKEPVAYIIKEKEFWSKKFYVSKGTLIPRPETELMIEKLVAIYRNKSISILDIGTGSGCILISLLSELPNSKGIGTDISKKALLVANKNAKKHKMLKNLKFFKKSLSENLNKKFDLIVSNPPYIMSKDIKNLNDDIKQYEPRIALDGGNDGLDLIKKIIYKTKDFLKINGRLALEIGNEQYLKVSKLLLKNNFRTECTIKDYKENIRCLVSTKLKN